MIASLERKIVKQREINRRNRDYILKNRDYILKNTRYILNIYMLCDVYFDKWSNADNKTNSWSVNFWKMRFLSIEI